MLLERIVAADAVPSVDMFCFNNELSQVAIALAINTNKNGSVHDGMQTAFQHFLLCPYYKAPNKSFVHTTRLRTKAAKGKSWREQLSTIFLTIYCTLSCQTFLITKPSCRKSSVTTVARDSPLHPSSEPPASSEPPSCGERHGVKQIALLTLELSKGNTL